MPCNDPDCMCSPRPVRWQGPKPEKCDICSEPLGSSQFVDGRTDMGPWAIMCLRCHGLVGTDLGTGRGQRYDGFTLRKLEG
jgi:hypothetical protein